MKTIITMECENVQTKKTVLIDITIAPQDEKLWLPMTPESISALLHDAADNYLEMLEN